MHRNDKGVGPSFNEKVGGEGGMIACGARDLVFGAVQVKCAVFASQGIITKDGSKGQSISYQSEIAILGIFL